MCCVIFVCLFVSERSGCFLTCFLGCEPIVTVSGGTVVLFGFILQRVHEHRNSKGQTLNVILLLTEVCKVKLSAKNETDMKYLHKYSDSLDIHEQNFHSFILSVVE